MFLAMRLSIVLGILVAAVGAASGAEHLSDDPFTALGLDSGLPIERNLDVLSNANERVDGLWGGSIGVFYVTLSGILAAPPNIIIVSASSLYPQRAIEDTFQLDSEDANVSDCPGNLLMDDGISCSAVFYECDVATRRCRVMVTFYSREASAEYSKFGSVVVGWSSEGFEVASP
jgi:hypothetical protein